MSDTPDLILHRGLFTTLDPANPTASAVAIKDGRFAAVGRDREVMPLAGAATRIVDLKGRRVLPGLIDNHLHIIRGGLNFNMELRWDGVRSLADAMAMLKAQVAITPPPQWVRVVGGFTEHQFVEKRLPTIDELNAVAPDTPVFLLHLYDRAILNAAALRAVGYTKETPEPPAGEIVRDGAGNPTGLLLAKPNAGILYATLARGPKLPFDYQLNSTRHFMRELNRFGVTGAIDAGGGFQNYPGDYAVIEKLAAEDQLTVRIAYNLFTQKPKGEKDDFLNWTRTSKYTQGSDYFRHNGAGEMLVFSAADFEDFRQPRPDMPPETAFGMVRAARTNTALYMRVTDPVQYLHVTELGEPHFLGLGFAVADPDDLKRIARLPGASGVESIDEPGGGKRVRLTDPDGHGVEIVSGIEAVPALPVIRQALNSGATRPRNGVLQRPPRGASHIKRIGHAVVMTTDLPRKLAWYRDTLGLLGSDDVYAGRPDNVVGSFNRLDRGDAYVDHHSLFFIQGKKAGLNHLAFEVQDVDDVMLGHDHLKANSYDHIWGIGRHELGSHIYDYWRDPWGRVHEHFTDTDTLNADAAPGLHGTDALNGPWGEPIPPSFVEHASV